MMERAKRLRGHRRQSNRGTSVFTLLFVAIAVLFVVGQAAFSQEYPRCITGCTAKDVTLEYAYLDFATCEYGGSVEAIIWVTLNLNRVNTYCLRFVADIYIDDILFQQDMVSEPYVFTEKGIYDIPIGTVTWSCGSVLELRNIQIFWSVDNSLYDPSFCVGCVDYGPGSKCVGYASFIVTTPLVVDYYAEGPSGCGPLTVQFISETWGGYSLDPYIYDWDFGDGTAHSTIEDPIHTYWDVGTYTVSLTVTDSLGEMDTMTKTLYITVEDCSTDLRIDKLASASIVAVGDTLTYTITVWNDGPGDATGVDVDEAIPVGSSYVSALPSQGTYDPIAGVWTIGDLVVGASATLALEILVDPSAGGTIENTACVSGDQSDPNPANNCDSTTTIVEHNPVLLVEKSGTPPTAVVGETVNYTIAVSHDPASDGSPINITAVTDSLGIALALSSGDDGDGLLEVGETWIYTGSREVLPTDPSSLVNEACVYGEDFEGDPVEDCDSTTTIVEHNPALLVLKSGLPALAVVGDIVNYTITIQHHGSSDGSPIDITDVSDSLGIALSGPSGDNGDGLLEANEIWTYTGSRAVLPTDPANLTNIACAYGLDLDGEPLSDCDSSTTTVVAGYVTITPGEAVNQVGDPHTFVITAYAEGSVPTDWDLTAYDVTSSPSSEALSGPAIAPNGLSATWELEINNTSPGVFSAWASVDISFGSTVISVSTNGTGDNSDPGEKMYIDVRLSLDPATATNQIGDPHIFTATLEYNDGSGWTPLVGKTIDFTKTSGVGSLSNSSAITDSNGEATVTLTSDSIGSTSIEASFDGVAAAADVTANDAASKTWIDVRLSLDPATATNQIGDPHIFTATLEYNDGSGWTPLVGKTIDFTKTSGVGSLSSSTATTNSSGQATVTLTSNTVGSTAVAAAFDGIAAGATASANDAADKDWIDVRLSLDPPSATNQIGDPHIFTATLEYTADGSSWLPLGGKIIDFAITSGPGSLDSAYVTTNTSGEATVILSSSSVGITAVSATFDGIAVGASATASDTASKDWIDVRVSLSPPSATNQVGYAHVFTAKLEYTTDGSTWLPLSDKTVNFSVTSGPGELSTLSAITNTSGEAIVILSSGVVGTTVISSSFAGVVAEATATASDTASKDWIDVRLSLDPPSATNQIGDDHVFTATLEYTTDGSSWLPLGGKTIDFTITGGVGSLSSSTATTNSSGQASVTLTSNTVGSTAVAAAFDDIAAGTTASANDTADKDWIDVRLSLDPPSATNQIGDPHIFTATLEYNDGSGWTPLVGKTIDFTKTSGVGSLSSSTATTNSSGQASVTLTSNTVGSTAVAAAFDDIAAGATASANDTADKDWIDVRLSLDPATATNQIGDDHVFTATLEYTTDGSSWLPLGGKTIDFTITGGVGSLSNSSAITDSNGEATVTLTSDSIGSTSIEASFDGVAAAADVTANDAASKTWIDVRLSLDPATATNQIGDPHIFTATLEYNDGSGWTPFVGKTIDFTKTSGVGSLSSSTATTNSSGQATVTLTSNTVGSTAVTAAFDGIVAEADATANDTADKDWIDVRLSLDPATATNQIGDEHVFTATLEYNDGSGWLPLVGKTIDFTKTSGVGSLSSSTATTNSSGQATVTLTSNTVGSTAVAAAFDGIVAEADATANDTADKDWIDVRLSLDPATATNQIGDPHIFTATLEYNDGSGWTPFVGKTIDFTKTSGVGSLSSSTATTNSSGQATVTLTSNTVGSTAVAAAFDGIVAEADATANDTADKDWIDVRLSLDPATATNQIGDEHVFTATLEYNDGSGWLPLVGKTISFTKTSGVGSLSSSTATTNSSGQATVTLTSNTVGSTAVAAAFDGIVAEADATANDTADKDWIDVRLSLDPATATNQIGDEHVFTATLEYNDGSGWLPLVGKTISFTKTSGVGSLSSSTATTNSSGQATVTLTSNTVGSTSVEAAFDGIVAEADATANDTADKDWIDVRLSLDPATATNQIGDEHVFTATLEYNDGSGWLPLVGKTISFTKTSGVGSLSSSTATTNSSGQATVTLTSNTVGSTSVEAAFDGIVAEADATANDTADKDWIDVRMIFGPDGAINATGNEHTFTATLEYTTNGDVWWPLDGKTIALNIISGPGTLGASPYVTDANGEVDVTLNSNIVGVTIVTASWNGTVLGASASASDPSDKTWVDARMSFGPDGATNAIGDEHTFTAHLEINDGSGWQNAVGETITANIISGPGTLGTGPYVTDANGEVDITLNSDVVAGVTNVQASWNGTVLGTSVSASDPSDKTWVEVGARMILTPDGATNEVGDPHVLTAHLEIYDGTSWQDAVGETITISITSGPGTLSLGPYVTDVNGQVDVILNSDVPGVVIVEASWSGTVLTFPVSASDTADKTYVDGYVTITPGEAVNEVSDPHTFTITAYAQGAVPTSWNLVLYDVIPAPASESLTGPAIAGDGMSAAWQLTINNLDPGVFSASASIDISFDATVVSISTDSTGNNGAPAGKTYVDARMSLGPDGATNEVGDEHTFTAHLEINDGSGWQNAVGETITVNIISGPGTLGTGPYVTDANGEVDITLNSDVAGVTNVQASWNGTVLGTSVSASDPSDKTWVDARMSFGPDGATNEVGDEHTFTAHLEINDGSGWQNADGETITANIISGPGTLGTGPYVTDANGEVDITLNSDVAGVTNVQASWNGTVLGTSVSASDPSDKTWVDARMSFGPDGATNEVGDEHTFTAHLEINDGSGWQNADGETITANIISGPGTLGTGPYVTDANGEVDITLNSDVAGVTNVQASWNGTVLGTSVSASDPSDKTWVDARMSFGPDGATNEVGDEHTFTAHLEINDGSGWQNADGETITVNIISGPGTLGAGPYVTDANGEVDITLNSDVAGVTNVQASWNGTVLGTSVSASDPSDKTWVDARMSFGPDGATNEVGDEHTFTAHLEINDGSGWQNAAGETITANIISGPGTLGTGPYVTDANGEVDITLNSDVAGVTNVQASWNGTVLGTSVSASDPSDKTWVDARMSFGPDGATNEVGDEHTFTAHLEINDGSGWQNAAGETITANIISGPGTLGAGPYVTDANGEVDITLNSDVAGVTNVQASWNGTVLGTSVSASDPSDKTWVEVGARMTLTPDGATNEVNDPHVLTAHLEIYDGTSWQDADGETISISIASGPGTLNLGPYITDANGEVDVTLNSDVPGVVIVEASWSGTVLTFPVSASDTADKTYVDGYVTITPGEAVNEVGDPHTFTITAYAQGAVPTSWNLVLYDVIPAPASESLTGPAIAGDGMSASWQLTINNLDPGVFSASASIDISFDATVVSISTDSTGNNGAPAGKTYVDARMSLGPDGATNAIGDEHTFTAHLEINDGSGWQNADGETITVNISSGPGTLGTGPYVTDANGEVDITLNSDVAGVTNVQASWNGTVLGTSVSASDPSDKTWLIPELTIEKTGDEGPVRVGDTIDYQITVTNTGTMTLYNVTVTDLLLGIDRNLGTFAPGDFQIISGTYGPVSTSDLPGPVVNVAVADSDETDSVEDDHEVEVLPIGIDLSLTKTVDKVSPEAGELVTFEIVVANSPGFEDATNVEVTDTLPAGYAFVGFAVSQGTYAYTGLNSLWIVGDLPAGSSATLHVFATVLEDGPYESPAEVTAADQDDIDSVPDNASILSEDDDDEAVVWIDTPIADLLVTKTVDNANPNEEDTVVFTITVYNGGPYTSTGIVLQDALPTGLTYVSDTSGGTYNPATNAWDVGTLIVGESASFTLSAQVDVGTAGTTLTNTALVIQNEIDDPSPANNQASADVTIEDAPAGGGGAAEECIGKVIISEIAWAGTAANSEDEWIELRNVGGEPVDLTGWVLRWRKKQPVTPEDFQWKIVPLSGEIQASIAPVCELTDRDPELAAEFVKREVDDFSWFVVARPVDYDESYMILERKSDLTISNVDADIIYDDVAPYLMELSNEGDIIELLNANGVIVDTANAFPSYNGNWPAGDALTLGTMERIDPLGPDERDNWHTNLGIITRGLDANGRPLVATSDVINSQTLEEMELFIELNAARTLPGARLEVGLDLSREVRRETGWPWIRITRPGYDATADAAGGGGGVEPAYSFASRYANDTYWLGIDTGGLVPGDYLVWVVYGEGQTVLVPITILD